MLVVGQGLRSAAAGVEGRRRCVELGIREYKAMKKTVSFSTCVAESLRVKSHRRPRTLGEIRSVTARMMRECPWLRGKMMRRLQEEECRKVLEVFPTQSGKRKARTILYGLCAFAVKRNWVERNVVGAIEAPVVVERKIPVLRPAECRELIDSAKDEYGGACLPAAALMLYAGIRPQEVRRLSFKHILLTENAVIIPAAHSKTGGGRRVTLHPVAMRYLQGCRDFSPEQSICPPGWDFKWRKVRERAGWNKNKPWIQDVLRHTYASYHALRFMDYSTLQWEMGHSDASLLRTRYLNPEGVGKRDVQDFWLAD